MNKEINYITLNFKFLLMTFTKTIQINPKDFNNIEKLFFDYLKENTDPSALETIQSIIDQCID